MSSNSWCNRVQQQRWVCDLKKQTFRRGTTGHMAQACRRYTRLVPYSAYSLVSSECLVAQTSFLWGAAQPMQCIIALHLHEMECVGTGTSARINGRLAGAMSGTSLPLVMNQCRGPRTRIYPNATANLDLRQAVLIPYAVCYTTGNRLTRKRSRTFCRSWASNNTPAHSWEAAGSRHSGC